MTATAGPAPAIHYREHADPRSSHQQILRILRQRGQSPVLDVGCAQGMLGRALAGSALEVDGVEPNGAWADLARPHYRHVYTGTIESAVGLPRHHYRTIVCGDVLEHTVDPVSVVRQLRELGTDDALFVISVPNVAHLAVRLMLLFGRFPKMERGILDKTHLHFWTRDTAADMLREGGLVVERSSATGVPLDEIWKSGRPSALFNAAMRAQHLAIAALPRVFGFQWIFTARPAGAA